MKRCEMVTLIADTYNEYKLGDELMPEIIADVILDRMEKKGILPPVQTVTLIPDELRGGMKHSPSQRVWDEE